MSWRNTTEVKDKIFGALVYLFPLYSALQFGAYLFAQFPFLKLIAIPLTALKIPDKS